MLTDKGADVQAKKCDPTRIKVLMMRRGVSQAKVARRVGMTPAAVSLTVAGKRKNPRIRQDIAELLSVKVTDLWPEEGSCNEND